MYTNKMERDEKDKADATKMQHADGVLGVVLRALALVDLSMPYHLSERYLLNATSLVVLTLRWPGRTNRVNYLIFKEIKKLISQRR